LPPDRLHLRQTAVCTAMSVFPDNATAQSQDVALARDGITLAGTFVAGSPGAPVVVIIPGSGPTDRNGNNPLGVAAAPYRHLAKGLADRGFGTVRIDKRGMFDSADPTIDPNAVTLGLYAQDVQAWASLAAEVAGTRCAVLAGHSEGALVALLAGNVPQVCGVILLASPGLRLGQTLRLQLAANPALALAAEMPLAELEAGRMVPADQVPRELMGLLAPDVQPFLIDLLSYDPARLAADLPKPLMILHARNDLQVFPADFAALSAARTDATLALIDGVNHVLKPAPYDRAANLQHYADPDVPVATAVLDDIAAFLNGLPTMHGMP
jgi:uncharacterized protein